MQLTDLLAQTGGVSSMARELAIDDTQAATGAAALLPAILGGLKKQAQSQPSGVGGLGALLGQLGGGGLLDDVVSEQPTNVDRGNNVLGQLFGSKDVSRTVAQNAAARSGLDPALLRRMLPMVAMLVTGYMAKQGGAVPASPDASGGIGAALGGLLAGTSGASGARSGGLASMLDMDGDGNPLDDILGMAGKLLR